MKIHHALRCCSSFIFHIETGGKQWNLYTEHNEIFLFLQHQSCDSSTRCKRFVADVACRQHSTEEILSSKTRIMMGCNLNGDNLGYKTNGPYTGTAVQVTKHAFSGLLLLTARSSPITIKTQYKRPILKAYATRINLAITKRIYILIQPHCQHYMLFGMAMVEV